MSFLFTNVFAQVDANQKMPIDPDVKIGKLDNGLIYYIRQNKKPENRVEMRLAINAGSLYETEAQRGLAHFCEHMCFNGTKNFEKSELVDFLEKMGIRFGADLNAYTSFAETVYMLQLPTDDPELLSKGYQVLEDWAHNVSFLDEEIDKERGVIKEEWRLGLGADDRMRKKSFPIIFKGSRYANRLPIGLMDVIDNSPYDTLRQFYKDWYRPNLMAVVVVGDIDVNEAEQKIISHFANIKNPDKIKKRIEYGLPDNDKPLISIQTDVEATNNSLQFFYKHENMINEKIGDYRQNILNQLYNGMLNNRLREISQQPDAPFIYGYSYYGDFLARSNDAYASFGMMKENQIDEGFEVLLSESERVKRFGFTETELERQKEEVLSSYKKSAKEFDKTPSKSYAREYVSNFLTYESMPGILNELKYVEEFLPGISLEEINALAKKWITEKNLVVSVTGPEKEGVEIPTEEDILKIVEKVKTVKLTAYVDEVVDEPLLMEIPKGTKVTKRVENKDFDFTMVTLGNGVQVIMKETDYKNDEILFKGFSLGGSSLYENDKFMSANFASNIINQSGIGSFDNTALEKKLAGKIVSLSPSIGSLTEGVRGSSTPADFETMLQLNYLYFTKPRKDKTAHEAFISKMKNQLKFMGASPQMAFYDTLIKTVSQNDPRTIVLPTEAQLNSIDLDDLYKIYNERYADASDWKFFLVGNFKTDSIIPLLETYLGGLPVKNVDEKWKNREPEFPTGKHEIVVRKGTEPKGMVGIMMSGDIEWNYEDRLHLNMMMKILSIKLRENMREDQGGVYGVQISDNTEKYPESEYSINVFFGCSPDKADSLIFTVYDEMNEIIENGPYAIDLEKVKESLIRERETDLEKNNYWLNKLYYNCFYEGNFESLTNFEDKVMAVDGEDIKNAASKYINLNDYVQVVLMPEEDGKKKKKKKSRRK